METEGIVNEKVQDDTEARISRISNFIETSSNVTVNMEDSIGVNSLLSYGDTLVGSLRCNEVQGKTLVHIYEFNL